MSATKEQIDAVEAAIKEIPAREFQIWRGGWPDMIGLALLDAVYSIRAVYDTKNPTRGVLGRLKAFREAHPEASRDLESLVRLDTKTLETYMGAGKTSRRPKGECVLDAAQNFLQLEEPVRCAQDFDFASDAHRRAYLSVRGIGPVTYKYFGMLLGYPGVKPDVMVKGFVNDALAAAGVSLTGASAEEIVREVHKRRDDQIPLHHFDHAIWRYQSGRGRRSAVVPSS